MPDVVAAVVPGRSRGDYLLDLLQVEQDHGRLYYIDAAMAYKEGDKVKLTQTNELTSRKGAFRGTWIGLAVGFILGGPIGGALLGAGAGALIGSKSDTGLSNEAMEQLNMGLDRGLAVVFVKTKGENSLAVSQFLEPHSEQVFVETIDDDTDQRLQDAYDEATDEDE
jgi:uncharacterized membrane protein